MNLDKTFLSILNFHFKILSTDPFKQLCQSPPLYYFNFTLELKTNFCSTLKIDYCWKGGGPGGGMDKQSRPFNIICQILMKISWPKLYFSFFSKNWSFAHHAVIFLTSRHSSMVSTGACYQGRPGSNPGKSENLLISD